VAVVIITGAAGKALTASVELAIIRDILVASKNARFADTHARVGIVPGWEMSQILPRMIGPVRARYMSCTGNFVDAATTRLDRAASASTREAVMSRGKQQSS
jgi:enoyl-CoA hydratase